MKDIAKFLILTKDDRFIAKAKIGCGGVCVIEGLPLGKYKLIQYEAPCGYICGDPVYFELDRLGCTRILDVPIGIRDDSCEEPKEIDYMTCANVAIRINCKNSG
ncbi:MAG TPA: SpaA isopeptide-forming pilin-related protein [Clostridia bacterium]|jgi:hypothetical protein